MKIVIVATDGKSLLNFRAKMIQEWVKLGNEVVCLSVEPIEIMNDPINSLGAKYISVAGNRTGISIKNGMTMINNYERIFKLIKPDICFLYMSKPIAFGGIAAIRSKISRIFVFQTGLEIAFYSPGFENYIIMNILKILYKYVQSYCESVFFMSHSDQQKMIEWNLVKKEQCCYVEGSGVDMNWFQKKPLPSNPVVLMTARLVWSKGIREYIEAASLVREKYPSVRFLLVGGFDENSEAISKLEFNKLLGTNTIEYCGYQDDVRPYLESCAIFVLPSYHEGKGKSILEAQAVGRPIITTHAPGCSETVIDGYNGFLVPVKNSKMLAEKIIFLVENPRIIEQMAENAYNFCKKTYDVNLVNATINKRMKLC